MKCTKCGTYEGTRSSIYPVEYTGLCGVCEEKQLAEIYRSKNNERLAKTHEEISQIMKEFYENKK